MQHKNHFPKMSEGVVDPRSAVPANNHRTLRAGFRRGKLMLDAAQTISPKEGVIYLVPAAGAARTWTFTAASILPLMLRAGECVTVTIVNQSANTITLAPATTVTANGVTGLGAGGAIATLTNKDVIIECVTSAVDSTTPGTYTLHF